jgi:hypothetical protein
MPVNFIKFVFADDWVAVYDDHGDLLQQGHSIQADKLLESLGFIVMNHDGQAYADENDGFGRLAAFPMRFQDLPEEVRESGY